jgi:hypothetical protein
MATKGKKAAKQPHSTKAAHKPAKSTKPTTTISPKSTTATSTAVVPVHPIALTTSKYKDIQNKWEVAEQAKHDILQNWAIRLGKTSSKILNITKQYKSLMTDYLQEAYAVYCEVENSDYADDFYDGVRWELKKQNIKTQSNTPNEGLLVRLVCGGDIATKTISDYSRVLAGAKRNNIEPGNFSDWVKAMTMTKVIADERDASSNKEAYADRLQRARLVVLRLLEARETMPIMSHRTTAKWAEQKLNSDGLWIGIGHARRSDNAGSYRSGFYADMHMLALLTPNIDIEIYIINQLAKTFVDRVAQYEVMINEFEEKVWANELWEKLISAGEEESKKADLRWANRQQAARFEDESEFREFARNCKQTKSKKKDK